MKTLIVVSGGDAPGINATIWQYTRVAARQGDSVVGAEGGFAGVLDQQIAYFNARRVAPFAMLPGSFLASSRDPVLSDDEAGNKLYTVLEKHGIDNLLLFGGNGTIHHVLPRLDTWDIPVVAIPTTIDNDVPGTEYTLGFDSACNYAYQAVDGSRATAAALSGRIFMIETLGGNTGMLALAVAEGAGADAVLVPEYEYDQAWLTERLKTTVERNGFALLVLSEGLKDARTLADDIPKWTDIRVRDIRLGHGQRGGMPTHMDRQIGSRMATLAYDALSHGMKRGVVVQRAGQLFVHEGAMDDAPQPLPDREIYDMINGL